jgi:hypothetical protein
MDMIFFSSQQKTQRTIEMLRLGSRSNITLSPQHLTYGSFRRYFSLSTISFIQKNCIMNHGKRMMYTMTTTTTTMRTMRNIQVAKRAMIPRRYFETKNNRTCSDDDIQKRILQYAKLPQTPVSLQTLLQTGRGEFLHKSKWMDNLDKDLKNDPIRGATGEILIQVREFGCFMSGVFFAC